MEQAQERKLYITKQWVLVIFAYYILLFLCGVSIGVYVLLYCEPTAESVFQRSLIGSISTGITASSVCYIRKLYKLCFRFHSEQETEDQLFLKRLGTIVYFIARPLFAIAFSIFVVVGIRSGLLLATSELKLDEGYFYMTLSISFYVGFLSGDFIKKLESSGSKAFDKLVG